jgi:SAM-dependent methyltransferase
MENWAVTPLWFLFRMLTIPGMNMWNERFAEEGFAYGTQPNDFLKQHASRLTGPVLSLAEGEGRNAVYLATLGLDVTGVDGSEVGLRKAKEFAARHRVKVQTVVSDLAVFDPGPACFHSIVSIFAHMPPDVRRRVHASVSSWLKPGGIFLLEAYTPDQSSRSTGGPRDPDWCMSVASLRNELSGFRFEWLHELEREVIEGRYHTGPASVVQMIAIKE